MLGSAFPDLGGEVCLLASCRVTGGRGTETRAPVQPDLAGNTVPEVWGLVQGCAARLLNGNVSTADLLGSGGEA